ncbi:hypothetical protein LCGC14_2944470, partial [marine sediment metagenome]
TTGEGLPTYGTAVLVNVINESGIYPTENFQKGYFPAADQASGEVLAEKYLTGKDVCFRCPIACGRYCRADGVEGGGPEYETIWAYSADCGISDLVPIIKANKWCNEYGLDTISAGATIACAMEMHQRGILKDEDVDGPTLEFGSSEAIVEWTRKMGAGEGFGAKLALGSYRLAELYGAPELSMSVKKLELPAYDPRGAQGHGLQYATSNRGGCHVRGYLISPEILGVPEKLDPFSIEGKAVWVKLFQDLTAVIDSLGLCLFTFTASAGPRSQPVKDEAVAAERPGAIDRARLNENVVTIMAGAPGGTGLSIAYDLAEVLDDGNNLRVVPMIGKGVAENVRDLLYLRGVDMAITQANILKHFARTGALGKNLGNQIT